MHLIIQSGDRRPSTAVPSLAKWATQLRTNHRSVTIWHFDADKLSERHIQLHAKFALADESRGYLGSANLTDKGFEINFEIGAELGPTEVRQLHKLLEGLRRVGVLTAQTGG